MADFIHSVLAQDETVAAGSVVTYNLPINPMSHILLTPRFLNLTANTKATLANILATISKLEVLFRGQAIISLSGRDLFAYTTLLTGNYITLENVINLVNAARFASIVIPFGHSTFNPSECFPKTMKGELQLQVTYAASFTNITTVTMQIETIELPGAAPKQYLKATTLTKTPTATGDHDVDLPIGNTLLGCVLFSTTIPATTAYTTSIDQVKLLVDNMEKLYSRSNWESLHSFFAVLTSPPNAWSEKIHMENINATYAQNADTNPEEQADTDLANYALLDCDPTRNGAYAIDTRGKSRVHLRITAGDTGLIRVVPIELVKVGA